MKSFLKGMAFVFGMLVVAIIAYALICVPVTPTRQRPAQTEDPKLEVETVKIEQSGSMVVVKAKFTNAGTEPISSLWVDCILLYATGEEIDIVGHYAIKGSRGGLRPGDHVYQTYHFSDLNIGFVEYVDYKW
jgi:Na+-transporting methylmalonyl-CoA/oxaloacetate decarboxylase gamma subunit